MGKVWLTVASAGWPVQRSTAEDMDVQVKHSLTTVIAGVDDGAVAIVQAQLSGDNGDHLQQMSAEFGVGGGEFSQRGDGLFGNEQNMHGRLWTDVVEGHAVLIFVDDAGRDFAVDDFLEDSHVRRLSGETKAVGT